MGSLFSSLEHNMLMVSYGDDWLDSVSHKLATVLATTCVQVKSCNSVNLVYNFCLFFINKTTGQYNILMSISIFSVLLGYLKVTWLSLILASTFTCQWFLYFLSLRKCTSLSMFRIPNKIPRQVFRSELYVDFIVLEAKIFDNHNLIIRYTKRVTITISTYEKGNASTYKIIITTATQYKYNKTYILFIKRISW